MILTQMKEKDLSRFPKGFPLAELQFFSFSSSQLCARPEGNRWLAPVLVNHLHLLMLYHLCGPW